MGQVAIHMMDPEGRETGIELPDDVLIQHLVPKLIEVGTNDTLFDVKHAGKQARQVAARYRTLGIADRFRYSEFDGGHELDTADANIDFLCRHVRDV